MEWLLIGIALTTTPIDPVKTIDPPYQPQVEKLHVYRFPDRISCIVAGEQLQTAAHELAKKGPYDTYVCFPVAPLPPKKEPV